MSCVWTQSKKFILLIQYKAILYFFYHLKQFWEKSPKINKILLSNKWLEEKKHVINIIEIQERFDFSSRTNINVVLTLFS